MNITLYSTHCPRCISLKTALGRKNISYTEENSVEKMLALGITQVPVLSIDGKMLNYNSAMAYVNEMEENE